MRGLLREPGMADPGAGLGRRRTPTPGGGSGFGRVASRHSIEVVEPGAADVDEAVRGDMSRDWVAGRHGRITPS
jgi:hypothetical protein